MPIPTDSPKPNDPKPADSTGRQIGVGAALSVVTCLLLSVGLMTARWLVGDSRPPVLELPVPTVTEASASDASTDTKSELAPEVLKPQQDTRPQAYPSLSNTPTSDQIEGTTNELPTWDAPLPIPAGVRTAERIDSPRFR